MNVIKKKPFKNLKKRLINCATYSTQYQYNKLSSKYILHGNSTDQHYGYYGYYGYTLDLDYWKVF